MSFVCFLISQYIGEVSFGDTSYTVNEGEGTVYIKVKRRGYLSNIVSVGKSLSV